MGLSTFIPAGIKIREEVANGTSKSVILIPAAYFETVKLLVNFRVNSNVMAFEMLVAKVGTDSEDTISSKVGNNLQILSKTEIVGTDLVLSITNNEATTAFVTILQLN